MPFLSAAQKSQYEAEGFVLLPAVFSGEECAAMAAAAERAAQSVAGGSAMGGGWGGAWREDLIAGEDAENSKLLSIHDMQFHDAVFASVLLDERLTEPCAEVIGPDIELHHVKYHEKPPATGTPFPMHMDYFYFPHERNTKTAYVIFIDEATIENGCLCVYPGSHVQPIPDEAPDGKYLPPQDYPLEAATPCPAPAGSVLMFNYRTIHGSYPNKSDAVRRMILYQVRAPDDHPLDKAHRSRGQGMMLRGSSSCPGAGSLGLPPAGSRVTTEAVAEGAQSPAKL